MKVNWRSLGKAAFNVAPAIPLTVFFGVGLFMANTAPTEIRLELAMVMIICIHVFVALRVLRARKG
jgi:hypothetical protein